ncbi:MAG: hypothetical protein KatS3mg105_3603 [Gemmatales bacterium]|nr:MAG: hypothetical protein KatS3mg105_3603 [Gemmatales bacterium]
MTLFGKFLMILNIFAATAFVYIAALDWGKRYEWSYAVFRQHLVINGLPLDDEETADQEGLHNVRQVDRLGDSTLSSLFAPVGGNPVRTQQEELVRLRDQLKAEINALPNEAEKRKKLKELLVPLARSSLDRSEVRIWLDTTKPFSKVMEGFDAIFAAAIGAQAVDDSDSQTQTTQQTSLAYRLVPRDKRRAMTHLLFTLHPDLQRVTVVVGLKALVDEMNDQADALMPISDSVEFAMLGDLSSFEVEYEQLLSDLKDLAFHLDERSRMLASQQELKKKHEGLVELRKQDIVKFKEAINVARKTIKELLHAQQEEERLLFESQSVLRDIRSTNERLEREIRRLEGLTR